MPLSLNVLDVWKLFSDGKKADKESIARWLDEVASDARQMALAWTTVCTELSRLSFNPGNLTEERRQQLWEQYHPFGCNDMPYYRLSQFYRRATHVLGGRTDETVHEVFCNALATILECRLDAKRVYDELFANLKRVTFLESENSAIDVVDLNRSVVLLNKEIAAFEVLAKEFRAKA
jgi:hypothetical protein